MKTPIGELIDLYNSSISKTLHEGTRIILGVFIDNLELQLQKEKAFAFDCFEAGMKHGDELLYKNEINSRYELTEPDFEHFYSQYATQHTK